ncbi:MAG: nucleotide exchange factor GrpE [Planctomycetota bacterium]
MDSSTENRKDDSNEAMDPKNKEGEAAELEIESKAQGDQESHDDKIAQEVEDAEAEGSDLESQLEELQDEVRRVRAEMQNFRRQSERRIADSRKFITKDIFLQVLPIVDNFDAAMKALDQGQDADNVLIGVKMIHEMLGKLLSDNQINRIGTADSVFDADLHEAVGREETEEAAPNTILLEIQGGYRLGDMVLRHARVNVAVAPSTEDD